MLIDRLTRYPDRGSTDRTLLNALLDEQWWGTLAGVSDAGEPWLVPTLFVRDHDSLLLHGSSGAGMFRHAAYGNPVAFSVTAMDAVVVGHNAFDSSANYRSAVLRGVATPVAYPPEKAAALDLLTNHLLPGRMAEVPAHTAKELAATIVLRLPIGVDTWTYKQRAAQASDPDVEVPGDRWGGVVPILRHWATPERAGWSRGELPPSIWQLLQQTPPA